MKHYNPVLESVSPDVGRSFTCLKYHRDENIKSNFWHYHPEIELIFVHKGSGKRQIGSNISYFTDGDLILIGSNLPHCGMTNENTKNEYEVVIQFSKEFLGQDFWKAVEMNRISALLEKAKSGIVFGEDFKKALKPKIDALTESHSLTKLLLLIEVLDQMSLTQDYKILNASKYYLQTQKEDNDRINVIFNYVKDHFKEQITLETVAELSNMTVPSFCRYFKKITNKTFTQFVNEYRITHSLKLLAEQPMSITEVCFDSGFNNFSYFNKTFKEHTQKSPSQYRKEFSNILA